MKPSLLVAVGLAAVAVAACATPHTGADADYAQAVRERCLHGARTAPYADESERQFPSLPAIDAGPSARRLHGIENAARLQERLYRGCLAQSGAPTRQS